MKPQGGSISKSALLALIIIVLGGGLVVYLMSMEGKRGPASPERIVKRMKIRAPRASIPPQVDKGKESKPQKAKEKKQEKDVVKKDTREREVKPVVKPPREVKKVARAPKMASGATSRKVPAPVHAKKIASGPWVVNLSSYTSEREAMDVKERVGAEGHTAYVTVFDHEGRRWYRVRVGFYSSKEEAKEYADRLSKAFNAPGAWVVRPAKSEIAAHSAK